MPACLFKRSHVCCPWLVLRTHSICWSIVSFSLHPMHPLPPSLSLSLSLLLGNTRKIFLLSQLFDLVTILSGPWLCCIVTLDYLIFQYCHRTLPPWAVFRCREFNREQPIRSMNNLLISCGRCYLVLSPGWLPSQIQWDWYAASPACSFKYAHYHIGIYKFRCLKKRKNKYCPNISFVKVFYCTSSLVVFESHKLHPNRENVMPAGDNN